MTRLLTIQDQAEIILRYQAARDAMSWFDRGCVYIIRGPRSRRIKIGFTTNLEERLGALAAANADDLQLLCVLMGPKTLEAYLHQRYARHRLHGEWFKDAPAIKRLADDVRMLGQEIPLKGIGWKP